MPTERQLNIILESELEFNSPSTYLPMTQSNEITQFEARAYKRLYEMYKSTLLAIIHRARNSVEYHAGKPDEMLETMILISDEHKWEHCGIESKTDSKIIDELEKCLGV